MDIVLVTNANTDEEARKLLALMGAPCARQGKEERRKWQRKQ